MRGLRVEREWNGGLRWVRSLSAVAVRRATGEIVSGSVP